MARKRIVDGPVTLPYSVPAVAPEIAEPTEEEQRIEFVYRLLVRGHSDGQIAAVCRKQFRIGYAATLRLIGIVRERNVAKAEGRRSNSRAEQIERLRDEIRELRTPRKRIRHVTVREPQADGKKTKMVARTIAIEEELPVPAQLARIEELLADLEGNRQPIRVEVTVRQTQALMVVFSNLREEKLQQLYEQARERRMLPAGNPGSQQ